MNQKTVFSIIYASKMLWKQAVKKVGLVNKAVKLSKKVG